MASEINHCFSYIIAWFLFVIFVISTLIIASYGAGLVMDLFNFTNALEVFSIAYIIFINWVAKALLYERFLKKRKISVKAGWFFSFAIFFVVGIVIVFLAFINSVMLIIGYDSLKPFWIVFFIGIALIIFSAKYIFSFVEDNST
ncbi:hypothetical protein [Halalkalibacter sp. APA_J-10(15)]|uniref:hypothetical protein n=1 Tax=Halalkalibacter sp. APA_J-10(15) TaxID=2933805 RepID=UPI001FF57CB0|nr:hypothetical protein [Halalkalibacter sp. APA_J-10(15)]MCK0473246.1 hypothetical protein [Halalkalibacter sp. APA_J-10(15)]